MPGGVARSADIERTPMTIPARRPIIALPLLLTAVAATVALGPVAAAWADDAPLSGPPVNPDQGKDGGKADGFGKGISGNQNRERPGQGMLAERRNAEIWRRALEQTMPELRAEVQDKVRTMRDDFESRLRAWREANGAALQELEKKARGWRDRAGGGAPPASGDAPGKGETPGKGADGAAGGKPDRSVMEQIQKLRESAPKVTELQETVWSLFSADEQAAFKKRYDAMQEQAKKRGGRPGQGRGPANPEGDAMEPDPMLPGGEAPPKAPPSGKPFNFDDKGSPKG
jgi:hypothetical protein